MKNKKMIIAAIIAILAVIGTGTTIVSANSGWFFHYYNDDGKTYSSIEVSGFLYCDKYRKIFKDAEKLIVYKKAENSKKFKALKTVDAREADNVIDKKAKGYVKYKVRPIYKDGKQGKSTVAFSLYALNVKGSVRAKTVKKGVVASFKVKNTSKRYKAVITLGKNASAENHMWGPDYDSKIYLTNKKGASKIKKVTVKAGKSKIVRVLIKKKKVGKLIKKWDLGLGDFQLKAAGNKYIFGIHTDKKVYLVLFDTKEENKLYF